MNTIASLDDSREMRKVLARRYVDSEGSDFEAMEDIHNSVLGVYIKCSKMYMGKLPHYDKDDYIQIGYIALWKVLERARVKPEIIDGFDAYLIRAIKNTYIKEFRKFVFKNKGVVYDYQNDEGVTISGMVEFQKYIETSRQKEREYRQRTKEQRAAYNREYNRTHAEQIKRQSKEYREKNKERIRLRYKRYYWEHREEILAKQREKRRLQRIEKLNQNNDQEK